ncbi:MMPL family transporter [Trueperella sp.]|uniref:MMPL family transporter n=1 Tax=Trueperella sp. TaxID=2699835 RepID=UPI003735A92B
MTENDQAFFLPESAESTLASEAAAEFKESNELPLLIAVVKPGDSAFTEEELAELAPVGEALPGVELSSGETLADVMTSQFIPAVPNEDATAVLLPLNLDTASVNASDDDGQRLVNSLVEDVRAFLADEFGDMDADFFVSGPAAIAADLGGAFAGIDLTLLLVAVVLVFIILIFVYRSLYLPIAVLITAIAALCAAVLVVYNLALKDVFDLNGQTQGILSILVIGATTDYSLLVVSRYRDELKEDVTPIQALANSVKGVWEPILASGGTVIAGLLALLLSDLSSTASLGPIAAIGIIFSMLAALTLLPGLLMIFGNKFARAVFWPAKLPEKADDPDGIDGHGIWSRWARIVGKNDRRVWVGSLILLVALAAFAPTFQAQGTSQTEQFVDRPDSVIGFDILGDKFDVGSVEPIEVVISNDAVDAAIEEISAIDGVESVTPTVDPESVPEGMPEGMPADAEGMPADAEGMPADAEGMPADAEGMPADAEGMPADAEGMPAGEMPAGMPGAQQEGEPLVIDNRVLLSVSTSMPSGDTAAAGVVQQIRDIAHELDSESLVGGASAQNLDTQQTARSDLFKIIPVVLIIIMVMLVILLRSFVAPLLLVLANILSFASAMGISAIIFNWILDHPGADASVPLYAFVFLVALGIDYTIFLMARVREESEEVGTRKGLLRGLAVTGGVITSAGIVLAATFGALAVIPLLFMLQLAIIVPLGLLIDTFIVRTSLIAGLVHDIGDPVWWPRKIEPKSEKASDEAEIPTYA